MDVAERSSGHASRNGKPRNRPDPGDIARADMQREFEFVAIIMRRPEQFADVAAKVRPEHLTQPATKELYVEFLTMHSEGIAPSFTSVADRLRQAGRLDSFYVKGISGYSALAEIDGYAQPTATPGGYVRGIRSRFIQLQCELVARELADRAAKRTDSPEALAAELEHFSRVLRQTGDDDSRRWAKPVAVSQLAAANATIDFLLEGCIARGHLTLFSALMKAGKSTFIGFMLQALQTGESFIGRRTTKSRTLLVSEESAGLWCRRRDALGLTDQLSLMCRPMIAKPSMADWSEFVAFVAEQAAATAVDLVVIDTTSAFAPWKSENDAAEVQGTITPLNRLTQAGLAVMLVHHIGKADQAEGRAARGSTALAGAVDIILELRRYKPDDNDDRRRVLRGLGRFDEIPSEIVVTLQEDGSGYVAEGDRRLMQARELEAAVVEGLPSGPPGMTTEDLHALMPATDRPALAKLRETLIEGAAAGKWLTDGTGRKGNPRRFFRP